MDLEKLVELCEAYRDMGWAVQAQLTSAMAGNVVECNAAALRVVERFLRAAEAADVDGAGELADELGEPT